MREVIPDPSALAELLPAAPTREQIERFAALVLSVEAEHGVIDISTAHHLAGNVYGRSVVIPAGTFLVGLPHKAAHLNVCVGDITVWTEDGSRRLTGAHIISSAAGTVRIGLAHADTTWLSVHANPSGTMDVGQIEDELVEGAHRLMTRRAAQQLEGV